MHSKFFCIFVAEKRSVQGFLLLGTNRDDANIYKNKSNEKVDYTESILDEFEVTKEAQLNVKKYGLTILLKNGTGSTYYYSPCKDA